MSSPAIPDYELIRCIGQGAYGEVWLARSTTLDCYRAVKIVYRDRFDGPRPYEREFSGIRIYEPHSGHGSQVRIYHVGENKSEGCFYYVMDLADDETGTPVSPETIDDYCPKSLASIMKDGARLSPDTALNIGREIAEALAYLHDNHLVHRDIKPANIVFVDGQPKLADIGLVATTASANSLVGTHGYLPPEGPGMPEADVFSLGRVLYEMATGNDRLDYPDMPADFAAMDNRESFLALNEIILKACSPNLTDRHCDGAELLNALRGLKSGKSQVGVENERPFRSKLALFTGIGSLVFLVLMLLPVIAPKPIIYVNAAAPEGGNGKSWNRAFRSLDDALAVAGDGGEIRIAQGIYYRGTEVFGHPGT